MPEILGQVRRIFGKTNLQQNYEFAYNFQLGRGDRNELQLKVLPSIPQIIFDGRWSTTGKRARHESVNFCN